MTNNASESPKQPKPLALSTLSTRLSWALCLIGFALSGYLVRVKLRLELDPTFESSCNLGSAFNCDVVQTSEASNALGYPLALWGLITYLAIMPLVWLARTSTPRAAALHRALFFGGCLVCLHSVYLAYVSSFVIGAYCLYCIGMYLVNIGLTVILGRSLAKRAKEPIAASHWLQSGGVIAVILLAFGTLTQQGYSSVRTAMKEERIAAAKAQLQKSKASSNPKSPSNASKPATTQDAPASPSTATVASGLTIRTHPMGFRYSEEVLRKGRSFFEVPVHEEDFALGPADAPVTIVEFADFECGYCRALTANIKPLKAKYGPRVRWVFKHFPLDNHCNKVMKGTQHPDACIAAKAANCAGAQGKFWEMHDRIYDRKLRINANNLRDWALEVGVEPIAYDTCFANEKVAHAKTRRDSRAGRFARIAGTPRTYINGHLVPGISATEVIDYYIQSALREARNTKPAGKSQTKIAHNMVSHLGAEGTTFWIDQYEASLDSEGRAISKANVRPAEASWYEAKAACEKASKRLCTERQWVTACTGALAIDDNKNGDYTDDKVEGSLFPYGFFHEAGRCNDNRRGQGPPVATGSMPNCVSPAGVFDQSGNLSEWTGADEQSAVLSGTDFRWGAKATCLKRQRRFGLGYRNVTTGFRCCADKPVPAPSDSSFVASHDHGAQGKSAPKFQVKTLGGETITEASLKGQVTIMSFFASWCGPCRRELPDLQKFFEANRAKGIRVVAFGVDTRPEAAKTFVQSLNLTYPVALDPQARTMGAFGVKGMPTAVLVDKEGVIRRRLVGINAKKVKAFKDAALQLL